MRGFWSGVYRNTLTMILAGGRGERLYPLTQPRSKPSVPFGGMYRIIDFTLSNCINSGFRRIYLLTQYKSQSLDEHIRKGWNIFSAELGEFIYAVPPQQRYRDRWYAGTADAIFQNFNLLDKHKPDQVVILSGDHLYKMDYSKLMAFHLEKGADVTVSTIPIPLSEAFRFGVCAVNDDHRIISFEEKLKTPTQMPNRPGWCLGSMGVYIFNTRALAQEVSRDARRDTAHDFGKNIIPEMLDRYRVYAYPFEGDDLKKTAYWRDIGTLDSYFEASMDLVSVEPEFNLYDDSWPIRTYQAQNPPVKSVWRGHERQGQIIESLVCNGVIVSGGTVVRSLLSPGVRINSYSHSEECIFFENVNIGRYCRLRKVIIDKNVNVPEGTTIGYNPEDDRKRFLTTENGVVAIPKGYVF
ncbi:MAG: glucose-1-phosphate adenylyltransferase [Myxococcales bacterium]|nr:MAG: glucose-1-phosphate adenylyltransferase [Myxococcales bacterium]